MLQLQNYGEGPKRRVRIARAVCKQVAYNHGYEQPITHTNINMLSKWEQSLRNAVMNGSENVANDVLSPQVGGLKQYLDMIIEEKILCIWLSYSGMHNALEEEKSHLKY